MPLDTRKTLHHSDVSPLPFPRTAYWEWDAMEQRISCSDALRDILDAPHEEDDRSSGMDLFAALLAEDELRRLEEGIEGCLRQARSFSGEFSIKRKTEEPLKVRIDANPFVLQGDIQKVIGTVTEIISETEHDRILKEFQEKELMERDQLFRLISENTTDLLWAYDLQTGKYTYSSPSVTRFCGRTQEEMLTLGLFDVLTAESAAKAAAELQYRMQAIAAGEESAITSGHYEFDEVRKDGSIFQTEVNVALVCNENAQITGVVGISRDITERIRNQQKKQKFEKNIYESQKRESIGRIASGIAQELNNTLLPVIGHAEQLMASTQTGSQQRQILNDIHAATLKSRDLVSQLVDFSMQQDLTLKPIDLNEEIIGSEPLLRGFLSSNIDLRLRTSGSIPLIKGDSAKIRQVIMNLAANAQSAMPQGGTLSVETAVAELDEAQAVKKGMRAGCSVELRISDTGTGIAPEVLPKIFDPFFTDDRTGCASGLGLAAVESVVKQHEGHISVESQIGEGCRVTISLPVTEEARGEISHHAVLRADKGRAGENGEEPEIQEHQLRQALEAERQAGELQQRFLTMISHEYRTPLAVISANLDILELQETDAGSGNRTELSKMRRAVRRLVEVMEISLERGRLYDPRTKAEFRRFEISPLIAIQLDDIRVIWPERAFTYTDGLGTHMIFGDTQYLKTALFNLLDNAQKYSPPGSPIEISGYREGDDALITIRNQGCFFSKEESEQLFGKYIRGTTSYNTSGAGIGLWLVREIIEQHGGSVRLEGGEHGILASVRIPLADYRADL
ncbi:MAG: ATP-binding protein [Chlorobiaceae bacterium]